jgi:hypothetical protein
MGQLFTHILCTSEKSSYYQNCYHLLISLSLSFSHSIFKHFRLPGSPYPVTLTHNHLNSSLCEHFMKIFLFISVRVFDVHSINDIFNFFSSSIFFFTHSPAPPASYSSLTPSHSKLIMCLLVFSFTSNVLFE